MNHKHNFWLTLLVASISTLNGCGGGSNNDRSTSSIDESSSGTTLSGNAVKGLMAFAPVSVFPITDGIIGDTALIEGETDANGAYQLSLPSYSGPVQVELSIDDDTLMICDAFNGCGTYEPGDALDLALDLSIDFGDQFHPSDPDLMLTALVPNVVSGIDTAVQITPLTHAAASFAMDNNVTLDASVISAANAQIASVLNLTINILNTAPVDITAVPANSDESSIEYASLLGALASMATTQGLSDSEMIDLFVTAFIDTDGQFLSNSSDDTEFTLEDLYANAGQVLSAAEDTSETSLTMVQSEMLLNEEAAGEEDSITVIAPPELPEEAIAAAKTLVSEVRTWGNVINEEAQDPLDDLDNHVRAIEESLDIAAENLVLKKGMENLFSVGFKGDQSDVDVLLDALQYALDITETVLSKNQTATTYNLGKGIRGLNSDVYEGLEVVSKGTVSVNRDTEMPSVDIVGKINDQTVNLHFQSSNLSSESATEAFIRIDATQTNQVVNNATRMTLSGGASITTTLPVNLNDDLEDEFIDIAILGMEVVIAEQRGDYPSTFTGTLTSVISRDLAALNAAVEALPLTGIPNLEEFPGVPDEIQADLYAQHFFRVTGEATGTDELLDGTLFWSQAANETVADGDDPELSFGAFNFTGELSNGLGDSVSGEFEFTALDQLDDRRNLFTMTFSGDIAAQSGERFEGSFSVESESPTEENSPDTVTIALDENGDEYTNLSKVTLSGEFNYGTGESILASAVANSDNAGSFIPDSDEDEDNFRNLDIALSFNAQLTDMPLARFTLSAQRTGFEDGIASMDISYGGAITSTGEFSGAARRIQLQLDSQQDLDTIESNQIVISNEQGIAITLGVNCDANESQAECENKLDEEGVHGTIMVGDDQVANIELADDIWLIRYVDGSFESLY